MMMKVITCFNHAFNFILSSLGLGFIWALGLELAELKLGAE